MPASCRNVRLSYSIYHEVNPLLQWEFEKLARTEFFSHRGRTLGHSRVPLMKRIAAVWLSIASLLPWAKLTA